MKKLTRGFTLIELLVVIAIIGILSSVVLVSLNTARTKARDGRIQAEVAQIKTQIEATSDGTSYYELGNSGTAVSGASGAIQATFKGSPAFTTLVSDIATQGGGVKIYSIAGANSSSTVSTGYSIYSTLNNGGYFCLDSSGGNKTLPGTIPTTATNVNTCQ